MLNLRTGLVRKQILLLCYQNMCFVITKPNGPRKLGGLARTSAAFCILPYPIWMGTS